MQKHIDEALIPTYQTRYRIMMSAIKTRLEPLGVRITTGAPYMTPESTDIIVPAGGFFTYISFPPDLPTADVIASRAREDYGLTIAFGQMFAVRGDGTSLKRAESGYGRGARLCWAWHESDEIEEGIERLEKLLKSMLAGSKST
jgi:DNA-binding transcriptional MocR family regulator